MSRCTALRILPILLLSVSLPLVTAGDEKAPPKDATEIARLLKQAILSADEGNVLDVLKVISRYPGSEPVLAVLSVVKNLTPEEETNYWFLLAGLGSFHSPEAFTTIGEYVVRNRKETIARDLMSALQQAKSKHRYFNRVIRRVLAECPLDLQLMAVDLAGQVPVRRTVDVLLGFYEAEDLKNQDPPGPLEQRLIAALEGLTGQPMGDNLPNWKGWWAVNRERGLKILRLEAESGLGGNTGILAQPLDPVRQREFMPESFPPSRVLVIKAPTPRTGSDINFDHIEGVLERLGVDCDVMEKTRIEEKSVQLAKYAAVLINCTQIHPFCESPGHQSGEFVGNRLNKCLGPAPHDVGHYGWYCGDACGTGGCSTDHPALLKIKKYVESGGYLFTEDWCLIEVLESLWPNIVRRGQKLEQGSVRIQANKGAGSHPLLRGVFVPPVRIEEFDPDDEDAKEEFKKSYDPRDEDDDADIEDAGGATGMDPMKPATPLEEIPDVDVARITHTWEIDKESHAIDVRSNKVAVLITSEDLRKICGQKAVAIAFQAGQGKVLHVLSHFGKQSSAKDEATIENLLVNWLLEIRALIKS